MKRVDWAWALGRRRVGGGEPAREVGAHLLWRWVVITGWRSPGTCVKVLVGDEGRVGGGRMELMECMWLDSVGVVL